ncbi:hypothetical protein SAMN00017405_0621 [Desulfonispora thiosulfatigenes DSM 11270]|uniref:Uncharacterized protein n=1 Tax=Desulfonispora thiosulfatigenes DSM 11270 TaxID=656914 RepID=A0A1W1V972_DESTI|nr:hypothetical protein [Desulfonispora thiosulfatigenes]SMB89534.1 hypothetical protein SAMN00017405_0621 [Desulfonispora thiosulfatigenes DSM 11270]
MRPSQIIYLVLVVGWLILPLTVPYKIIYLGFIAIYLSIHNLMGLRSAEKNNTKSNKREFMVNKFGPTWGRRMYNILFILAPFVAGLYVIGNGILILFTSP